METIKYFLNLNYIKSIMQERGINEEQLAEQMGVSKKRLHKYLNSFDYKTIPYKIFYGLMVALKVSFTDIITEA